MLIDIKAIKEGVEEYADIRLDICKSANNEYYLLYHEDNMNHVRLDEFDKICNLIEEYLEESNYGQDYDYELIVDSLDEITFSVDLFIKHK